MKKYVSIFAALTMAASALVTPLSASADFSDVADDYIYKDAITTLSKLNVINGYDNGTFEPTKDITRAEFTKIIVYMLGYSGLSTKITQFDDVSESHWANENIKVAYDLGIINGFDDTTFKPDDPVTYEQALKMIVCTLGYQSLADKQGGYPQGYISQATALDLNDNIKDTAYTDNASRGVVAQIMYNALEIDMYESTLNGWQISDKTLLNDYLGVYRLKGTVVGVEDSTTAECSYKLYEGQMCIKDQLGTEYVIDYTEYTKSAAEMSKYVGNTIQIFYRKDKNSEDKWLVEIDDETYTNDEVLVESSDIDSFENNTLKYYKPGDSRASTVKLDTSSLTVRYNGRAISSDVVINGSSYSPIQTLSIFLDPDSEDFIYGTVRFIDSGSTGSYKVVDIYDYDTIVAYGAPSSAEHKIADKTVMGNYLILDPDSIEYKYAVYKDGKEVTAESISSNDVINYAKSLDGDLYTVNVTSKSVSGAINALNIDNGYNKTITVDGTEYGVTDRFIKYIDEKEQTQLKAGMDITIYLDMFGNAEWGTVSQSNEYRAYAYIIDASTEGEDVYLKLFAPASATASLFSSSSNYRVKTYKLDPDVKINGSSSSTDAVLAKLEESAESSNPDSDISGSDVKLTGYNQFVKIGFSIDGNIDEIITADSSVSEGTANSNSSRLIKYKGMDPDNKYYVSSSSVKESSTGSTYYSIRSTTPMFVIPEDRTDTNGYALRSAIESGSMSSGGEYYLEAFDVDNTKYPACILIYQSNFKSGTAIAKTTPYKLVAKEIGEVYDSQQGEAYDAVSVYDSSLSLSTVNISNESAFSDISKGDVILFGLDNDRFADSVMKVQDYDEIRDILDGDTVIYESADGTEKEASYYWNETQRQTEENSFQLYKFDWRYPKSGLNEPTEQYYETGGNVTDIYSRAAMFNVIQVLIDDKKLYVTKNGFDESGVLDESEYEEINVSSSTKYLRYDEETREFTPFAAGTGNTNITVMDLKDAKNFGIDCSKVLITYVSKTDDESSSTPTADFIVIYD